MSRIGALTVIETGTQMHVCMSTWAAIRSATVSPGEPWSGLKEGASVEVIDRVLNERGYEC